MNPAMVVKAAGRRSRSSPRSSSGTGVVAARMTEVATPRVPLATMFQAAQSPSTDSATPSTSTRSPCPTRGRNTAKSRNGSSMTRRLARVARGSPATLARTASATA